ncbi:MAG TPA: SRPBCC family protein [Mycobacteriales bacterium]|nr:SRPBCC family protein [Mycobacteriales bacterium]
MNVTSQVTIARSRHEVFDFLAHAELLPIYATDFDWVQRTEGSAPGPDAVYTYRMTRGAQGTFRHVVFEPNVKLAWQGPPARSGPGTVAPAGNWILNDADGGTIVTLTMSPELRGLLRLMAPFLTASIRKTLPESLQRLKAHLEASADPAREEQVTR